MDDMDDMDDMDVLAWPNEKFVSFFYCCYIHLTPIQSAQRCPQRR
jgi:hypothetical protein